MEYKAVKPDSTIERIEQIIASLGISFNKTYFGKEGVTNSVRVDMIADGRTCMSIGSNGKGLDTSYALASAYGEFMERVQNKMLFITTNFSTQQFCRNNGDLSGSIDTALYFRYFPDESYKTITQKELSDWIKVLLPLSDCKHSNIDGKSYDMPFINFYNVKAEQVENLPYDLVRFASGSTGLCAGNTPQEAILQGINEIFERFVLQRLYIDKPILPTIPKEYFQDTEILSRIKQVEAEKGWKFIIKDCSINKGFPVIGLLVIDSFNARYTFRLGADLSPEIALQRCFTEIFQGTNISDSIFIPFDISQKWDVSEEYNKNVVNGRGQFCNNIFLNETTEFIFDISKYPEQKDSIDESLKSVFSWLKKNDYNVFIRDNSFLGFPAFHIYIPGLSDIDSRLFDIWTVLKDTDEYYTIPAEYRLKHITKSEARMLIEKYSADKQDFIQLFPYSTGAGNIIDRELLVALLSCYIEDYGSASRHMDKFLQTRCKSKEQFIYYYVVRDFFALKDLNTSHVDIKSQLACMYPTNVVTEVLKDLHTPEDILKNFPFPECFDCNNCPIRNNCIRQTILDVERNIQSLQKENYIDQRRIEQLFK